MERVKAKVGDLVCTHLKEGSEPLDLSGVGYDI